MKSSTQGAYTAALTALYNFLKSKGKHPKYQCLENKVSTSVNKLFADVEIDAEVQFVPPNLIVLTSPNEPFDTLKLQSSQ